MYEELRKIQLAQLDILKQVIKICNKYDITYFASYGTLLGAVRHKGFIPWDDDVDIYMPRPDYEKFCDIAEKELEMPYFFQSYKTDPNFHVHMSRVQNLNTTYIVKVTPPHAIAGIFVDITPLDGCKGEKQYYKKVKSTYRLYKYCAIDWMESKKYFGKAFKRLLGKIVNLCIFGNKSGEYFFELQEQLYKAIPYDASDYVADFPGGDFAFKKELLKDKVYLDFEDIKICCPNRYKEILEQCYGDYMVPPPENRRGQQHGIVIGDVEKPYTEYLNKKI